MKPRILKQKIKEYRANVGKRTRGTTKALREALAEAEGFSSTNRPNVEAEPAYRDSDSASAPIRPSDNPVESVDTEEVPRRKRGRPKGSVGQKKRNNVEKRGRPKGSVGQKKRNNVESVDTEEVPRRKRGRPKGSVEIVLLMAMGNVKPETIADGIQEILEDEFYKKRWCTTEEETSEDSSATSCKNSDEESSATQGNENEDLNSEDIDRIVEEELINLTTFKDERAHDSFIHRGESRTSFRMDSSARPGSSEAKSPKNADIVEELAANIGKFTSEDPDGGSDKGQTDKSRSFTEEGGKSRISSRTRSSARQRSSTAISRINADTVEELPTDVRGHVTSEDAGSGSDKERTVKSRSSIEKEEVPIRPSARRNNNAESVDTEEVPRRKRWRPQGSVGLKKRMAMPMGKRGRPKGSVGRKKRMAMSMGNVNADGIQESDEGEGERDIPEKTEATEHATVFSEQHDFCSMLTDAILGNKPLRESGNDEEPWLASPSKTEGTLPRKFRFEDEGPKEVERTAFEKEMDDLFTDMDSHWALAELASSNCTEDDQENKIPLAEETHVDRCNRGMHELIYKEDEGLICRYCHHVAVEPKDILPDWAEKTHHKRKRYRGEVQLEFDGLHFQHSVNAADYGNDVASGDGTVWSIKAGIRDSMYEHQREGFEFIWKNLAGSIQLEEFRSTEPRKVGGCIISHAPGTGKTRLTINFVDTYMRMFPMCMPVIIAPASMLLTWEEEFRKWNVGFPFVNLNNPEFVGPEMKGFLSQVRGVNSRDQDVRRLLKILFWSMGNSILGISYTLYAKFTLEKYQKGQKNEAEMSLSNQQLQMRKILLEKPGLVVLDEGHTPRNQRSNIWNAIHKIGTAKRVILSGTPFQNNILELFNTLHLVRPAIADELAKERTISEMIAASKQWGTHRHSHSQASLDRLKDAMTPFVHVHKGTILQQSLPGLRDCVILLKPSALQKSLIKILGRPRTFRDEHRVALASVHPYLVVHDLTREHRRRLNIAVIRTSKMNSDESAKIKFVLELVHVSSLLNEKVLIFSQYIKPLGLISDYLKERFNWADGKEILKIEGKMDQKLRQTLINAFNDPRNESKVMLGSMKCCSEGISLIGASRVILLNVVWNPSVQRQAIARAYRIGQKKFVYTYHLITTGTTEAEKYIRQNEKERLSELVFTSSSNEGENQKQPAVGIEDGVLEQIVSNKQLKGIFDKIVNHPKDADLIETFGLT